MAEDRNNAHMGEEEDDSRQSRFAHLLQPIKELAENWSIDIAKELEDYLEELETISFRFDDPKFAGGRTLNFAEAALLIQGSACIYSKKVEYLYSLLYQTLDMISAKKKAAAAAQQSSIQRDGKDADAEEMEEPEFLPLDDILEVSENIDLVKTPKRKGGIVTLRTPSLALLPDDEPQGELRFRINSGFVHSSGALLLEDERYRLDDTLQEQRGSVQLSVLVAGDDNDDDGAHDDAGGIDMLDVGVDNEDEQPAAEVQQPKQRTTRAVAVPVNGAALGETITIGEEEDPWKLLDPHSTGTIAPKPFKKKNTCRAPVPKDKEKPRSYKAPGFAEFAYLYEAEAKKRLVASTKTRGPRKSKLVPNLVIVEEDDVDEPVHDDNAVEGLYGDAPVSDDEGDVGGGGMNVGGGEDDGEEIARLAEKGTKNPVSYEELVRTQVEAYVAAAQQYADETSLSRRVAEWTSRLEPILEDQERRPAFDVHYYGATVLEKFKATKKKGPLQLKELVTDEEEANSPYAACRYFVTALHLINNGNIDPIVQPDHSLRFTYVNDRRLDSEMVGAFGEVVSVPDKHQRKPADKPTQKEAAKKPKGKRVSFAATKSAEGEEHEEAAEEDSEERPLKKGKGDKGNKKANSDTEELEEVELGPALEGEIEPIDLALVAALQREKEKAKETVAQKKIKKRIDSDASESEAEGSKKQRPTKDATQKKKRPPTAQDVAAEPEGDAANKEKENASASKKGIAAIGKKMRALSVKT